MVGVPSPHNNMQADVLVQMLNEKNQVIDDLQKKVSKLQIKLQNPPSDKNAITNSEKSIRSLEAYQAINILTKPDESDILDSKLARVSNLINKLEVINTGELGRVLVEDSRLISSRGSVAKSARD